MEVDGEERLIKLEGVELIGPPSPAYFELFARIAKIGKPLRCRFAPKTGNGPNRASLLFYGWQDKSGDVWLDLASTLVDQGFARAAEGE